MGVATPYRHIQVVSPIYRVARRLWRVRIYSGSAVRCIICERRFSSWLDDHPHGDCPHCGSGSRHRFLWSVLAKQWPVSLLHFAPEECLQRRFKRDGKLSRYVTVDRSAPNADIHADIAATGLAESSFKAIVCCHVLEHIPDDRAAMRELFRVLAPGGIAYLQVPCRQEVYETDEDSSVTDPAERNRRFGQFDHVRMYGRDIVERLRSVGFQVSEVYPHDIMSTEEMATQGLWSDVLFECAKP